MRSSNLQAISPIDGRYQGQIDQLIYFFSEAGIIYSRLAIEIEWLKALAKNSKIKELKPFSAKMLNILETILHDFGPKEVLRVKEIEQEINHDVKAVEYFLKETLAHYPEFIPSLEFIHFGATSEDINNLVYAIAIDNSLNHEIWPKFETIAKKLQDMAHAHAAIPLLARTHGQPATTTTVGKEFANFFYRLVGQYSFLLDIGILGKFNGAVGNFNALTIAYPEIDWPKFAREFVESLDLAYSPYTTQIEPHDYIAEFSHALIRINNILIALCRDIWGYIALGYFTQKIKTKEVGSSTMPHKVNPINFENAEGNLGVANALFEHFANKLPISRWQRDLSDSTVMRNLGVAIGHALIAYNSIIIGLEKLEVNQTKLAADLDNHWEILAEAIQTVMRRYGVTNSYEQLRQLTRGNKINKKTLHSFITKLPIPATAKKQLLQLTPANYLGKAVELAKQV